MSATVQAAFTATLVDEWVRCGLRHAVVAPGSRSTPMALALAGHDGLVVHVAHDERTAAFLALGIGLATGVPAAVLCTSGTAATHFHAAVVEAHQSGVPFLVLTADRPPELHGVGAPQTIDQQHLYGTAVRWFHDPGVPDPEARGTWRELARQAMQMATGRASGPVHLNLPFRDPLVPSSPAGPEAVDLAPVGHVVDPTDPFLERMYNVREVDAAAAALDGVRGVIVAGRGSGDGTGLSALSAATGWPVLAEPRARYPEGAAGLVRAFDPILRHATFAADHRPEVVLRVGELPASKVLGQWLAASGARQVHVIGRPCTIDPDGVVSVRVQGDPDAVCRVLAERVTGSRGTPWAARWQRAEQRAQASLDAALSTEDALTDPGVARTLLACLPIGAHLMVSSSMPVRDLEWFGGRRHGVTVHANRGANGIDGVLATATGIAAATGAPTAVLLGDLALLHDSSSLTGLTHRGLDVRIVVVDNDGGGIFSFLPQAAQLDVSRFEQLFGTPHGTDLVALARAHGLPADDARSTADLVDQASRPGPHLVRIRSDRQANVMVHQRLNDIVGTTITPG